MALVKGLSEALKNKDNVVGVIRNYFPNAVVNNNIVTLKEGFTVEFLENGFRFEGPNSGNTIGLHVLFFRSNLNSIMHGRNDIVK